MRRTRGAVAAALLAVAALTVSACGTVQRAGASAAGAAASARDLVLTAGTALEHHAPRGTGDFFRGPARDKAGQQWVQLGIGSAGGLDPVVTDATGRPFYRFAKDSANPPHSACSGDCAATWRPVLTHPGTKIFLAGVARDRVGVVRRGDGGLQLTLSGHPLYRYTGDTTGGTARGEGLDGAWSGVAPDGGRAPRAAADGGRNPLAELFGTAAQHHAPATTGDLYHGGRDAPQARAWVELSVGTAGGIGPIVHDAAGFTFYRFDKDGASPSRSACDGACAKLWPPVLVRPGTKVFLNGVPGSAVGVVRRPGGGLQLTLAGRPLYRYAHDTPGGTGGEGVDGSWFAASPSGAKVLPMTLTGGASPSA